MVTARKTADLEDLTAAWPGRIVPAPLEPRDPASCQEASGRPSTASEGIDVLVDNAGDGLFGAIEEVSDAELREQLEILVAPGPTPLRIPVGADAYGHPDLAEQAAREEYAAARAPVDGPPPAV
ncbi:hypothetical protein ACFY8C_31255 [Streptomyces flavochromogenes]|uniref:Uncharacterized protein n=1 Tax=Streptomyces flavochromogenes TaxID=68199 RepID=A0ABW6XZ32_9ACTN